MVAFWNYLFLATGWLGNVGEGLPTPPASRRSPSFLLPKTVEASPFCSAKSTAADYEWTTSEQVQAYLDIADNVPHRSEGEATLLAEISPRETRRILDLGCGDGRLLSLVLNHCGDEETTGVGLDFSPPMLSRARARFDAEIKAGRVSIIDHNMDYSLPSSSLGNFDCIVSSFAIHHCPHERKRELYKEVHSLLQPGGIFCNLEHVSSPSERAHRRFVEEMPNERDDPSNQLLDVETQLLWLRELGYEDVDCYWKWREMTLLLGRKNAGGISNE